MVAALGLSVRAVHADDAAAAESGPAPYTKFITGAQVQNGLFNVIRKNGKVYLEIAPSQLDQDFIQSAETVNGLGGYFVIPGGITSWTRIVRFTRNENKIVVTWPNTYFIAPGNDPAQQAISRSAANSTVAVAPIVASDYTPYDAQSLARAKLVALRHDLASALGHERLDELTRAHLESLQDVVSRALDARVVVPAK